MPRLISSSSRSRSSVGLAARFQGDKAPSSSAFSRLKTRSLSRLNTVVSALRSARPALPARRPSLSSTATTTEPAVAPANVSSTRSVSTPLHKRISYPTLRSCSSPVSPDARDGQWGNRAGKAPRARTKGQLGSLKEFRPYLPEKGLLWLDSSESLVDPVVASNGADEARSGTPSVTDSSSTYASSHELDDMSVDDIFGSISGHEEDLFGSPTPTYASPTTSPSPAYTSSPCKGFSFSRTPPLNSPRVSLYIDSSEMTTICRLPCQSRAVGHSSSTGSVVTERVVVSSFSTPDDSPTCSTPSTPSTFFSRSRSTTPTPSSSLHFTDKPQDPFSSRRHTPMLPIFAEADWQKRLSAMVTEEEYDSSDESNMDEEVSDTPSRPRVLRSPQHRSLTPLGFPFPSLERSSSPASATDDLSIVLNATHITGSSVVSDCSSLESSFWECRGASSEDHVTAETTALQHDPGLAVVKEAEGESEVKWELVDKFPRRSC